MSTPDHTTPDAGRWERVHTIFGEALELSGSERDAFLEHACGGEVALLSEVRSLIRASEQADEYFTGLAGRAGMAAGEEHHADAGPDLEGRVIGAYRLGPLLGRGGMGAVHAVERADGQFEQSAALKILPLGAATPDAHRRFLEERRILARLDHPNIARLYDGGVTEDGTPYFVMERVYGIPLTEYCTAHGLPPEERLRLFLDVCDAVSFAHSKLVVHRDLKPNNILVTASGQVKLLDFGIARLLEPGEDGATATALGGRLLTPRYASPEQLRGEPVTTSSDVYTLGVVLHELLTGISPYDLTGDTTSMVQAICTQTVTVPSARLFRWARGRVVGSPEVRDVVAAAESMGWSVRALSRHLRGDLDNILLMALRKEPGRRYPSVEALASDIRRHLEGFPVKAAPERVSYVAGRFLRRNAIPVATGASILILFSVLLVMSVRFAVTTREQAEVIARERDRAEEIAHFMRELFEIANPTHGQGETVTARELLDAGVRRIREDHPDEPALQAEMMTVLGTVYHHLGLPGPALEILRQAWAIQSGLANVGPGERVATRWALGRALRDTGSPGQAVAFLREARDSLAALKGPQSADAIRATLDLGMALYRSGARREAMAELTPAMAAFRALGLRPGDDYADALLILAEDAQIRDARAHLEFAPPGGGVHP